MKLKKITPFSWFIIITYIVLTVLSFGLNDVYDDTKGERINYLDPIKEIDEGLDFDNFKTYSVKATEDKRVMFYTNRSSAYRYGPSIMRHEDGSMDMWVSSPGNNKTQWDWIRYRHSADGVRWGGEYVVLYPSPGSADQCSVCDPGVIYFNGYYYLAYTSTHDYGRKGTNNSAFVARSKYPGGPYEKWNGSGWGGSPKPFIDYRDDPSGWGIGEVSFVIKDEQLYIYYTYFDTTGGYTNLAISNLDENWPLYLQDKGNVLGRTTQDSIDVVYVEEEDVFLAFSIENRMSDASRLTMYQSKDGAIFNKVGHTKSNINPFAHNMGISKDESGHIRLDDDHIVGYAYGPSWGRWSMVFQHTLIRANQ